MEFSVRRHTPKRQSWYLASAVWGVYDRDGRWTGISLNRHPRMGWFVNFTNSLEEPSSRVDLRAMIRLLGTNGYYPKRGEALKAIEGAWLRCLDDG